MKTYGIVGEIYMEKFQYDLALSAFKEGLILARSLNYEQEYFMNVYQFYLGCLA